ncbi:MAG: hypothetical protein QUS14_11665 [Pyrinomonadaceae bacterium]|nr:hypothetical protein [Pyrinomonadaceae bacterium]
MKGRFVIFASLALGIGALVLSGCGSPAGTDKAASASNSGNGSAPRPVAVDANEVNSPQQNANPNLDDPGIQQASNMSDLKQAKLDKLRNGAGGGTGGFPSGAAPLKRETPDDSQYWSVLTDVATETRQFRSNPQIAKVEKINDGKTAVIKIHLRNGKVMDFPGNRVADISRESVNTFIAMAGLTPAATPTPPPAAPSEPNPQKKRSVNVFPKVQ